MTLLTLIYISGWIYVVHMARNLFFRANRRDYGVFDDRLLLLLVSLIPLGKLLYFPVTGEMGMGLKVSFLILNIGALFYLIGSIQSASIPSGAAKLCFLLLCPAILSLPFVEDYSRLLFYYWEDAEQWESALGRIAAFIVLMIFSLWVAHYVHHHGMTTLARIYCNSLLFAIGVGILIAIGVFQGQLGIDDLAPISADTHLVGNIYRFNPGANVNEFGVLLAYGIIFVLWLDWKGGRKAIYLVAFLLAEFFTLTRGAWLGLIAGLMIYSLGVRSNRRLLISGTLLFFMFMVILASLDENVAFLIESRTSLEAGPSGEDRLDKYEYVLNRVSLSADRLLFGYGWSSNLYVHSVPLQLLYETGLVGLLTFVTVGLKAISSAFRLEKISDKYLVLSLVGIVGIVSLAHHNLYHMQTWLIVGLLWAVSIRSYPKQTAA